ncbi:hypothetical protein [Dyadobacter psychrotolerans]|uniref:Uncharacterized protein n=1 Tax=Dyadobacter psychrotolerans TaxID=2541721 RepID=A0A4R5DHM9_9BACT|nr:hypothetical protein [Dyadobacter psychrotolerans]TDE13359.1 hypothetical protein E0F88_20175 [Dyadobacter psychrotolerans]
MNIRNVALGLSLSLFMSGIAFGQTKKPLQISGVYPHLAAFNEGDGIPCIKNPGNGIEIGIGAVVPWAGKLWMITYSPHCPEGSSDKLYTIDDKLNMEIRPESVGGTPANRMIHKESNQLLIGPYLIDASGKVRTIPPSQMPGRLTATARHLTDPANKVYYYEMEGALYEADVNTLKVNKLFTYPIPGWHGKGGYTAQGQLVLANNGERANWNLDSKDLQVGGAPKSKEDMGVLASWDGKDWKIIERKQFTDVTGPGGIYGSPDDKSPLWSIGWDKRSVILKLLDSGKWSTYRLPKSTHTYDGSTGVYTEWPRIREIGNGKMLMDMHGMFYNFPKTFTASNTSGILPVSSHLRYIPDFTNWNGQLLLASDETSLLQNPMAGRSQSNIWFGKSEELKEWGAASGWGGIWMNDQVTANTASDAFLINGFGKKILHLNQDSGKDVKFTIEIDVKGDNNWKEYSKITVPSSGYQYHIFPDNFAATWVRIKSDQNCVASAFFHYQGKGHDSAASAKMFQSLAGIDETGMVTAGLIRPAAYNKNLQFLDISSPAPVYYEVDEKLAFSKPAESREKELAELCKLTREFETDEASVIVKDKTGTYRLPKTSAKYDQPFTAGWPRDRRELMSERYMFNAHGTFYEVPRDAGFSSMRPITTHKKQIVDFCTWRGLLVLSGTGQTSKADGHYFAGQNGQSGLWFGAIDDLWKLGKPIGEGGVWKNTQVKAGEASLPYLMTGYDQKKVTFSSDKDAVFTIEIDFGHNGWNKYQQIKVPAGKEVVHVFPKGFNAHWVRVTSDKDSKATAWFKYE